MSVQALLSNLDAVRQTGQGRWVARCPAHADRHPSLSVRELDDGRILLHCFAGCDVESVLAAVGLEFGALYPERAIDHRVRRRNFNPMDVLCCIATEAEIASIAADGLAHGLELTPSDRERLRVAATRIYAALELLSHG
jgi:hypothetical protein